MQKKKKKLGKYSDHPNLLYLKSVMYSAQFRINLGLSYLRKVDSHSGEESHLAYSRIYFLFFIWKYLFLCDTQHTGLQEGVGGATDL